MRVAAEHVLDSEQRVIHGVIIWENRHDMRFHWNCITWKGWAFLGFPNYKIFVLGKKKASWLSFYERELSIRMNIRFYFFLEKKNSYGKQTSLIVLQTTKKGLLRSRGWFDSATPMTTPTIKVISVFEVFFGRRTYPRGLTCLRAHRDEGIPAVPQERNTIKPKKSILCQARLLRFLYGFK